MSDAGGPLRVCILLETYHPEVGGGEAQGRLLARSLADRGAEVTVLTRRSRADLPRRERVDGIPVRRLPPAGRGRYRKWGLLATAFPYLLRARNRLDVLIVAGFRISGLPAVAATKLLGRPCVLKADSNGEMSGAYFRAGLESVGLSPGSPPVRAFMALRDRVLRRAEAFVAISSQIEHELLASGVDPAVIHRIPNCVDVERFRPASPSERARARRGLSLEAGAPVVVYTGRLVSYKGLPVLVRAWPEVLREVPGATLLLVGEGGSDMHDCEAELRAWVARSDLPGGRVRFVGAVHDVVPYLHAADAFAFPTEEEAFGISLVEAMACGLPCVTTTVGGVGDIVTEEKDALVVAPGDRQDLAGALHRVLTDVELAERLGREARRTAVARFGRDAVTDRYVSLLRQLAGREAGEMDGEAAARGIGGGT